MMLPNYRIIYRVESEIIEILAILHGHRELLSKGSAPWDVG